MLRLLLRWILATALTCLCIRPALAHQPAQITQLSRYDVLTFSEPAEAGLSRHRSVGVFDAAPEEIIRVVTTYDRYGEYLPRITGHTLRQEANQAVVLLEAALPWPLRNLWVHARFEREALPDRTYRVSFTMLRGNVQRYEGSIVIEPFPGGRSAVTYEVLAQPGIRLPRSWVQDAVRRGTSTFVHCLRSRVNQMIRNGTLRPAVPSLRAALPTGEAKQDRSLARLP